LAQGLRSTPARVKLPRESAEPHVTKGIGVLNVAPSACPKQIRGRIVFFVPVDVADFNVAFAATQTADEWPRRRAGVGSVAQGPVGDVARFLAQRPARRVYQSGSSS
jgi:hypothetical protein